MDFLPGGSGFIDVTQIFVNAAADMEEGGTLLMDDFTLQDAMSAFEIGEPRLDSGIVVESEKRPPFNPLQLLLPEEICWILDRSFACEMEWHSGSTLSQTVFTLLYVHRISEIEHDLFLIPSEEDPTRPQELITVVLRAAVLGLLKCCDMAWRRLSKGFVIDGEDWQGEKCEISLLEGMSSAHVLLTLDDAISWLSQTSKVQTPWKEALINRLCLRKTLLQLLQTEPRSTVSDMRPLLTTASTLLANIQQTPSPVPRPLSPANLALDPYIARRLNPFVPMRAIETRSNENAWETLSAMLETWAEIGLLCASKCIATWEIVGNHRLWVPSKHSPTAFIRTCTQLAFDDGSFYINELSASWLLDRFFMETLGVSYNSIMTATLTVWTGKDDVTRIFTTVGTLLTKLLTLHMRSLSYNPPRRRRHFVKSLVDWHELVDVMTHISSAVEASTSPVLHHLHVVASLWRLKTLREVVFSGFQLELYGVDERPSAYWYASQIIEQHLNSIDTIMSVLEKDSLPYRELQYQHDLSTALQIMAMATFMVSVKLMSPSSWQQMKSNFRRRYKWAFVDGYIGIRTPASAQPDFHGFLVACQESIANEDFSPSESFKFAKMILDRILEQQLPIGGWAAQWGDTRTKFIQNLQDVCERLYRLPASMKDVGNFDLGLLKWDPQVHPWFPLLSEEGASFRRKNIRGKTLVEEKNN